MKVLLVNKFVYGKGGDAHYTLNLAKLLSSKGNETIVWGMAHPSNQEYRHKELFVSNVDLDNPPAGLLPRMKIAAKVLYSFEAKKKMRKIIEIERPDIVHLNNFAHQISPSILDVFKRYSIPAVMTMHDFKLVCASYRLLSGNKLCELCSNGKFYECFLASCVKGSAAKSLLSAAEMYLHHRVLHIYKSVKVFIAPSSFMQDKIRQMGFKGRVVHLPNFVDAEKFAPEYDYQDESIVYFGRLSEEKGLLTLLEAFRGLDFKLMIIGDGPMRKILESRAKEYGLTNVKFAGYMAGDELKREVSKGMFVVLPSEWYENCPFSVMEAFALGKSVVASRIGGIPELVLDGETGYTFDACDVRDLRAKIKLLAGSRDNMKRMGMKARSFAQNQLSPARHYDALMKIYESAIS